MPILDVSFIRNLLNESDDLIAEHRRLLHIKAGPTAFAALDDRIRLHHERRQVFADELRRRLE